MSRRFPYLLLFAAGVAAGWLTTVTLFPAVTMAIFTQRAAESPAGWNAFYHAPPVDARRQTIVRPSPDLLYSICPFDLSRGPLEITAAPIRGRYSSISVFDASTNAVFVRNDEAMAGAPVRVILARPGQRVPRGAEVVVLRADRGIALQRVLLRDPAEAATIDPLRRRATCSPWR